MDFLALEVIAITLATTLTGLKQDRVVTLQEEVVVLEEVGRATVLARATITTLTTII